MQGSRTTAALIAMALLVAACGGRDGSDSSGADTTDPSGADATEPSEPTEATETGVTADEIVIGVVVDVDNPVLPGLGQPMLSAVEAWADYVNESGGLAGREVTIKLYDSQLNPDEATSAVTTACDEVFALIGSAPFALLNSAPLVDCADHAGAPTGLPDLAALAVTDAARDSSVTFGIVTSGSSGEDSSTVVLPVGDIREAAAELGGTVEDVHGLIIEPGNPGSADQAAAQAAAYEQDGATIEAPIVYGDDAPQAQATPIVQQIRNDDINYVWSLSQGIGNIMAEARVQGIDMGTVEWACTQGCMSTSFLESGGAAVEGMNLQTLVLPWTDEEVPAVAEYRDRVDEQHYANNGVAAWTQGLAFGELVQQLVDEQGVNSLTRANLLELIRSGAPVSGGGILPPDFVYGGNSACHVWMVIEDGEFVRANPAEQGEFACDDTDVIEVTSPAG